MPTENSKNLFAHNELPNPSTPSYVDLRNNQVIGIAATYHPHHSGPNFGYLNCKLCCNQAPPCASTNKKDAISTYIHLMLFDISIIMLFFEVYLL